MTTTWKCPFVEGENTIQRLSFSFSEHRYSLKMNWRRGNHREYTFFKRRFCSCRCHCFLSSLPRAWSKISSRRLRNLISQLSFLLVPNMVLAKIKIHEHRTKQTCEIYTFQTLMSYWSQTLWVLGNFQPAVLFVSIHSATYFIVFPVLVILHFVFSLSEESAARLCSALCFNIYLDC